MHVADEVAHLLQRLGRRRDHQVDPVTEHVQLVVGDEHRDLDQASAARSRPVISQSIHTSRSSMALWLESVTAPP